VVHAGSVHHRQADGETKSPAAPKRALLRRPLPRGRGPDAEPRPGGSGRRKNWAGRSA